MAMFHVLRHRSGPDWDQSKPLEEQSGWTEHAAFMDGLVDSGFVVLGGPLADEHRVVLAVQAESADAGGATLADDPWHRSHPDEAAVDPWTIRLDGRRPSQWAGSGCESPGAECDGSGERYDPSATFGSFSTSAARRSMDAASRSLVVARARW